MWIGPSLCTYADVASILCRLLTARWKLSPPGAAPTENRASRRPRRVPMLHSESKKSQCERIAMLRFDQLTVKTPRGLLVRHSKPSRKSALYPSKMLNSAGVNDGIQRQQVHQLMRFIGKYDQVVLPRRI